MHARRGLPLLLAALALPAAALATAILGTALPLAAAMRAMLWPAPLSLPDLVVHDAILPRILTAWAAGAGLAMAATLLQHALRNPLGSPTTFGISAGGGLAVAVCLLVAPSLIAYDRALVALAGAASATGLVLLLARRQRLSPDSLAVAGLLVTLCCGAATTCLALLQGQALGGLAIWGAGSLDQRGWLTLRQVLLHAGPAVLVALPLLRPLDTMRLDDAGVRNLGLSPGMLRVAVILVAVWLGATIIGAIGNIGFVDLAAAACARLAGARRLRAQMLWGALIGAAMLWLADGLAQLLGRWGQMPLPTGAVTALAGAPMLVLLACRERTLSPPDSAPAMAATVRNPWTIAMLLLVLLAVLTAVSLCLGHAPEGWRWSTGSDLFALLPWRAPRVLAALAAGISLAIAGVLVQGLMANQMASPELLGVGPAASIAGVMLLLYDPGVGRPVQLLVAAAGAVLALLVLLAVLHRGTMAPSRLVLLGIGLAALLGAGLNVVMALLPLDTALVLSWVSGSTYHATMADAVVASILAIAGLTLAPLTARWLDILPLGDPGALALGVDLRRARLVLVLLIALLSAGGTLMVGPFAFVGLMAPHLARLAGARRPSPRLLVAALVGGGLLVVADFLGRNLLFPYQMPAGTMASFLGMLPMTWLLFRR